MTRTYRKQGARLSNAAGANLPGNRTNHPKGRPPGNKPKGSVHSRTRDIRELFEEYAFDPAQKLIEAAIADPKSEESVQACKILMPYAHPKWEARTLRDAKLPEGLLLEEQGKEVLKMLFAGGLSPDQAMKAMNVIVNQFKMEQGLVAEDKNVNVVFQWDRDGHK